MERQLRSGLLVAISYLDKGRVYPLRLKQPNVDRIKMGRLYDIQRDLVKVLKFELAASIKEALIINPN